MPLILAIESDRRQAARIASLARDRLNVELLVTDSAEEALNALAERTPDLILTPHLMSPKDEAALDDRLRQLDAAGSHVQTLMIPVLASSGRRTTKSAGLLNRLRRSKGEPATEGGCDPAVFAAQITEYLDRAAEDRAAQAIRAEEARAKQSEAEEAAAEMAAARVGTSPVAIPEAQPEPVAEEPAVFEFQQAITVPDVEAPKIASEVETALAVFFEGPQVYDPPTQVNVADLQQIHAVPDASVEASAADARPAAFDGFVTFDELGVVESPSVALGEFAAFVDHDEPTQTSRAFEASAVLDSLELLDDPEISDAVEPHHTVREKRERRPAAAAAPGLSAALEAFHEGNETEPVVSDFDSELWMPLPVAAQQRWPRLEGPALKTAPVAPAFDAPPDPDVEFAAPLPPPEDRHGKKRSKDPKPVQDEWGFFDPVQCGFAALLAKLDEVTDKEDAAEPKATG